MIASTVTLVTICITPMYQCDWLLGL